MERLWSYLRRFNRMTKEMRPSHRIDILAHALIYYGMKKKEKLSEYILYYLLHYDLKFIVVCVIGRMLVVRLNKAHHMKHAAQETFELLAASCEGKISLYKLYLININFSMV